MSFSNNIQDLIAIINPQLQSTQTLFDSYIASASTMQPALDNQAQLHEQVRDAAHRLKELNQLDETYTQTYLNFKASPPKKGFFYRYGLYTVQDWTLAMFYLSYVVFSIIILLFTFTKSYQKILATSIVFTGLCTFGLISTSMIVSYG
jgi:hypothetical protein